MRGIGLSEKAKLGDGGLRVAYCNTWQHKELPLNKTVNKFNKIKVVLER